MRIAYLVLVHKNAEQLERMIKAINHEECTFFLHVDAKMQVDISSFSSIGDNVRICDKRFDISLFSFEMVEATLELIDTARKYAHFDYYVLISGQDYPLTSPYKRINELDSLYPSSYIDITPLHKGNWVYHSFVRSNCFKKLRAKHNSIAKDINNVFVRFIYKMITVLPLKLLSYFVPSPKRVLESRNIMMYGGAQWWMLSNKAIDMLLKWFDSQDQGVKNALRRVGSPDETFFQTCLMNTPYKNCLNLNDWKETEQNNKTFAIFDKSGHPKILKTSDYQAMAQSCKLFARKFDTNVDSEVLDMIDKDIS